MTERSSALLSPTDDGATSAQLDDSLPLSAAAMQRAVAAARSVTSAISSSTPQRRAKRKLQPAKEEPDASAATNNARYRLRSQFPTLRAAEVSSPTALPDVRDGCHLPASELFLHTAETKADAVIRTADNCQVFHIRRFLSPLCIRLLHAELAGIRDWQTGTLYGHPLPRRSIWYGPGPYKYAARIWPCFPHPPFLAHLGSLLTAHMRACLVPGCQPLTGCLVNRYRDGSDSMGKHCDDEAELGPQPTIVSLSLGQSRSFCMARKAAPAGRGEEENREVRAGGGQPAGHGRRHADALLALGAQGAATDGLQVQSHLQALAMKQGKMTIEIF